MHTAIIAQVEKLIQIEGADKVQIALILGEYCVVGKNVTEGMLGVLFPADLQLSEEYCRINNLNRDSERNADTTKKGFFDKNRKVRAQKFLKVNSTAYFADLESLHYTGVFEFNVMDKFNDLNGVPICKRFVSDESLRKSANVENSQSRKVNEVPLFMKHVDTEQFAHNAYKIQKGALLSFHSKRHGTSGRYALLPAVQTLPTWKKLINKVVDIFPKEEYDFIVGSRNVVLKNANKEGFHGSESFRFQVMDQLVTHLKEGMCVYVEIVGNVNGKSIMPAHSVKELKSKEYTAKYGDSINYNYGCKEHEFKFFIYRITMTGTDGEIYEWDQKRLENWCNLRGLNTTLEVHPQMIYDGNEDALKSLVTQLTERPDVLTEDYEDPKHVSEGIIIRIDYNGRTDFMKSKSVAFKIMEGIMKEDDIESLS